MISVPPHYDMRRLFYIITGNMMNRQDLFELFEQRKKKIRDLILGEEYTPMKFKELACYLEVSGEDRRELKAVVDALVEDGTIELTSRGKYVKPRNLNVVGHFIGNARGFGFVTSEELPEDVFIPAEYVNGALHGDTVRIRIKGSQMPGKRREGCVLSVLERGLTSLVGTYHQNKSFGFVLPDETRFGKDIFVPGKKNMGASQNDKVVVRITDYGTERKNPEGEITRILGSIDDPSTDVSSILVKYGIEEAFPKAVLNEASGLPDTVTEEMTGNRKDLRDLLTVTIDGEDARDLDDAITLVRIPEGYRLGVHIADVSHYVTEGSALDEEAIARGTSVYLADRVIPMLPRELSNGICSLNAGTDRLALSCIMTIDPKGNVIDHAVAETVIRVDRRMSYTGVQAILDGEDHPEGDSRAIVDLCFLMKETAALLKEKRRKRGAIDFDFPESKIILDEEGFPVKIYPYPRNTATDIIEDFMLIANETIAEDYFWQEIPFLYRVHEAPDPERIKKLDVFIRNFGYYLKTGRETFHPKEIQKLLFSLEGEPEEALISRLALRSMQKAAYSTQNVGHFGLSTQYYTHFTSPIRRYPDLQIHRIIKEGIHGRLNEERLMHYEQILPSIAESSSRLERRAQDAERDVEKLKKVEYMEQHLKEAFSGVISAVTANGFFVELDNTVEGFVPIFSLMDGEYVFYEDEYKIWNVDTRREFTLGQKVDIVVYRVDKISRNIDFMLKEFCGPYDEYPCAEEEPEWEVVDADGMDSTIFSGDWDDDEDELINDRISDEEVERLLNLYSRKKP